MKFLDIEIFKFLDFSRKNAVYYKILLKAAAKKNS